MNNKITKIGSTTKRMTRKKKAQVAFKQKNVCKKEFQSQIQELKNLIGDINCPIDAIREIMRETQQRRSYSQYINSLDSNYETSIDDRTKTYSKR